MYVFTVTTLSHRTSRKGQETRELLQASIWREDEVASRYSSTTGNQTLSKDDETMYPEDQIYWVINTCIKCVLFYVDTVDTSLQGM